MKVGSLSPSDVNGCLKDVSLARKVFYPNEEGDSLLTLAIGSSIHLSFERGLEIRLFKAMHDVFGTSTSYLATVSQTIKHLTEVAIPCKNETRVERIGNML